MPATKHYHLFEKHTGSTSSVISINKLPTHTFWTQHVTGGIGGWPV